MEESDRGASWMRFCELYLDDPANKEELDSILDHTDDFIKEMTACMVASSPSPIKDLSTNNLTFIAGGLHNALLMGYWLGKNNMVEPEAVTQEQIDERRTGCICDACKENKLSKAIMDSRNDPRTS